jgi:NAD(P)-dependent dehydrogenase (short-subunit alcohol dehydrogenase family)
VPDSATLRTPGADLAGRVAVVTGGAHGIGLAIVRRLAAVGARVIALDKDGQALGQAASITGCTPIQGDLAVEDPAGIAERVLSEHGLIEIIVNNVGVSTQHRFLELGPESFDMVFSTNLRGPWFFSRRLIEGLIEHRTQGTMLFISSVHDSFVRLHPHYSASKAAVSMLVKELAYELAPHGIRVNGISPGWIKTGDAVPRSVERAMTIRIPVGRAGDPDDVARLAIVLLSDEWSSYVTGVNLRVDGGLSLHSWIMDL